MTIYPLLHIYSDRKTTKSVSRNKHWAKARGKFIKSIYLNFDEQLIYSQEEQEKNG